MFVCQKGYPEAAYLSIGTLETLSEKRLDARVKTSKCAGSDITGKLIHRERQATARISS